MSFGYRDSRDAILAQEGYTRCVDGCPHFKMEKPCKKKPPQGYCAFYDEWLHEHGLLPGYMACDECIEDSK